MQVEIQNWIDEHQRGKAGIYPYQVAINVCAEFNIPLKEATEYVLSHIRKEINGTS